MSNLICPKCHQEFAAAAAPWHMAECPFCGHVFSSATPADTQDESVQPDEPAARKPPVGVGVIVALIGLCIFTFARLGGLSLEAADAELAWGFGAVVFGFGTAWAVFHAVRANAADAGFALLVIGVFILAACLLAGWTSAILAGGFLAVAGAVLMLKK